MKRKIIDLQGYMKDKEKTHLKEIDLVKKSREKFKNVNKHIHIVKTSSLSNKK